MNWRRRLRDLMSYGQLSPEDPPPYDLAYRDLHETLSSMAADNAVLGVPEFYFVSLSPSTMDIDMVLFVLKDPGSFQ